MEGTIRDGALYEALVALGRAERTGILTVQGEEEIIAFSISKGEIVSADALNQTLEEGLGEVLIENRMVSAEDFSGLAAEYQAGGGRVIDLLVERSYLSRAQLLAALREHTYRLCLEAFTWREGEFRFYQGEEVAFEEGFQPIEVDELCVRATQDLGAGGPLEGGVPAPATVYRRAESFLAKAGAGGGEESLLETTGENYGPAAYRFFSFIDGERSLAGAATEAEVPIHTAQHLAHRWAAQDILELRSAVERPEPVEPRIDLSLGREEVLDPVEGVRLRDEFEDAPPPEVEPERTPRPRRERFPASTPWPSRVMGIGLWAAAVVLLITQPTRILLPFPWQGGLREDYRKEQRRLIHFNVEQAATTFFLLNGRYPEELGELESARLLSAQDRFDPSGEPLVLSSATASFAVETDPLSETASETSLTSTITGNFLLDPEFVSEPAGSSEPPLVLLD